MQIAPDGSVEHFYGCVLQSSRMHLLLLGSAEEVEPWAGPHRALPLRAPPGR